MNDTPMAEMSGASRGAFRRRRYAIRSASMFRTPQKTIAARIAAMSASHGVSAAPPSRPRAARTVSATNVPSMNRSPCEKLISSMIP